MKDLFDYYMEMPKKLFIICDKWQIKQEHYGLNYKDCDNFLKEVETIGYTFEYGLNAEPFNLKKL